MEKLYLFVPPRRRSSSEGLFLRLLALASLRQETAGMQVLYAQAVASPSHLSGRPANSRLCRPFLAPYGRLPAIRISFLFQEEQSRSLAFSFRGEHQALTSTRHRSLQTTFLELCLRHCVHRYNWREGGLAGYSILSVLGLFC